MIISKEIAEAICAELPDADFDNYLPEVAAMNMINRLCGALSPNSPPSQPSPPGMIDGKRSKKYPREFFELLIIPGRTFVLYTLSLRTAPAVLPMRSPKYYSLVPKLLSTGVLSEMGPSEVSDELLLKLYGAFGHILFMALNYVEQKAVIKEVSETGRSIYKVSGKSSLHTYLCSWPALFCSCLRDVDQPASDTEEFWCAHLLAVSLSDRLGITQVKSVSDDIVSRSIEILFQFS
nr:unnamed protein product [Spirometra erinaceieuropaei]